jgi:hypothetical protein
MLLLIMLVMLTTPALPLPLPCLLPRRMNTLWRCGAWQALPHAPQRSVASCQRMPPVLDPAPPRRAMRRCLSHPRLPCPCAGARHA